MREGSTDGGPTDLDGLSVERATAVVADGESDPDEVRETLAIVARDGTVSRAAVDDAVANASMVVTTAETRAELAAEKLDGVREAAAAVSDLDLVSARLGDFDSRLDAVEDRADDLGDAVREVLGMKAEGDLHEIARRIRRVTNAATEVQRAADDLQFELDSFEEWLTDADRRVEELTADLDAVAESVAELDDVAETLDDGDGAETLDDGDGAETLDDGDGAETLADGDGAETLADDGDPGTEAARTWAAATVRHRVASLMIADLRAELAALRTWAEREGGAPPSGVEPRLDEISADHEAVGERLAASADPEWTARFGDRLAALDEALGAMEPPVSWGEVEAVVEEHRPAGE